MEQVLDYGPWSLGTWLGQFMLGLSSFPLLVHHFCLTSLPPLTLPDVECKAKISILLFPFFEFNYSVSLVSDYFFTNFSHCSLLKEPSPPFSRAKENFFPLNFYFTFSLNFFKDCIFRADLGSQQNWEEDTEVSSIPSYIPTHA